MCDCNTFPYIALNKFKHEYIMLSYEYYKCEDNFYSLSVTISTKPILTQFGSTHKYYKCKSNSIYLLVTFFQSTKPILTQFGSGLV